MIKLFTWPFHTDGSATSFLHLPLILSHNNAKLLITCYNQIVSRISSFYFFLVDTHISQTNYDAEPAGSFCFTAARTLVAGVLQDVKEDNGGMIITYYIKKNGKEFFWWQRQSCIYISELYGCVCLWYMREGACTIIIPRISEEVIVR